MTKTEAADILANKARVLARESGHDLDKNLIEAVLSEARHWGGLFTLAAEAAPHWRTVLRAARAGA